MPHLRLLRRRHRRLQRLACILHLWVGCALLLSGCSRSEPVEFEAAGNEWVVADSQSCDTDLQSCDTWPLAPHAEHLPVAEQAQVLVANETQQVQPSPYWQFSDDTRLVCLPGIEEAEESVEELAPPTVQKQCFEQMMGKLILPLDCADQETPGANGSPDDSAAGSPDELSERDVPTIPEPVFAEAAFNRSRSIKAPVYQELSPEERQLLDLIKREALAATTGVPTDAKLDLDCREKIAAAYGLSQRGAAYAARQELIAVLRLISQAKDSREGTRSRTEGLAAGLRALEEAEDFSPRGSQLEADMQLEVVCAAHRTPLAREMNLAAMLPAQMMERYHRYAQIKLAVAVAGEPAGSMALYSLGKLNSQLAATEAEQHPLATRGAVAFQQAALLAHNGNFLAAHELGVLLAETGHFPEALHLLSQVAAAQPDAVVLGNLACVQDELGQHVEAHNSRYAAQMLAQQGRGPKPNVAWVSPQDFSRNQMNTFTPQVANRTAAPSPTDPAASWR